MAGNSLISWGEITDAQFSYGQPRPAGVNPASCLTWQDFISNLSYQSLPGTAIGIEMITNAEFIATLYVKSEVRQLVTGADDLLIIDEYNAAGTSYSTVVPLGITLAIRVDTVKFVARNGRVGNVSAPHTVLQAQAFRVECTTNGVVNVYLIA